jgi:hypothetical protein
MDPPFVATDVSKLRLIERLAIRASRRRLLQFQRPACSGASRMPPGVRPSSAAATPQAGCAPPLDTKYESPRTSTRAPHIQPEPWRRPSRMPSGVLIPFAMPLRTQTQPPMFVTLSRRPATDPQHSWDSCNSSLRNLRRDELHESLIPRSPRELSARTSAQPPPAARQTAHKLSFFALRRVCFVDPPDGWVTMRSALTVTNSEPELEPRFPWPPVRRFPR